MTTFARLTPERQELSWVFKTPFALENIIDGMTAGEAQWRARGVICPKCNVDYGISAENGQ